MKRRVGLVLERSRRAAAKARRGGFTLIEIITVIAVLGVLMIPLGLVALGYTTAMSRLADVVSAEAIARTELARIANLAYNNSSLNNGRDATVSNYDGLPFDVRRTTSYSGTGTWGTSLKTIRVRVYPSGVTNAALADVTTCKADYPFGP